MARSRRAVLVLAFALIFFFGLAFLALLGGDDSTSFVAPRPSPSSPTVLHRLPDASTAAAMTEAALPVGRNKTSSSDDVPLPEVDLLPCARQYFENNFQHSLVSTSQDERAAAVIAEAGIDKVYMVHYTPMKNRRITMTKLLAQHGVYAQWVTGFDKEVLNESTASCFHAWRPETYQGKKKAERRWTSGMKLGNSQRSVVTKHHSAIYDMYRMGYRHALVLEDDALLRTNFKKRLAEVMKEVPVTYDVIMIGGCMKMHAYRRKFNTEILSKHVYRKREARCAHAFVVSQKGARLLLSSLPLTAAIDFQMTSAMNELEMEVYWIEPWMSVQGPSTECVTLFDLGVPCKFSTAARVEREFDARFANDTDADRMWDVVPSFRSVR